MWVQVIILVLLVQIVQGVGNRLASRMDKRIR